MTKAELIKALPELQEMGFMTHKMLLEIYPDNEEIPRDMIDMVVHLPEPPQPYMIFCGAEFAKGLDTAFNSFKKKS